MIETSHLSKLYSRGVYALRDLSLTIDKGEFMFLTGPSGAGKSTFLRLLLRQDLQSEGTLTVQGRDLKTMRPAEVQAYRRTVGFVFQDFRLIPRFTVFQNVAFVMRVLGVPVVTQQRKTFQVLKWVGLQHRMNASPEELSGGEQQRVRDQRERSSTIRSFVLADEPTGNLDPDLSLEIMNLFREINARGTTVVVATHDRELIRRVGRRSITLDHGRVVEVALMMRGAPLRIRRSGHQPLARPRFGHPLDGHDCGRVVRPRRVPDGRTVEPRRAPRRRPGPAPPSCPSI